MKYKVGDTVRVKDLTKEKIIGTVKKMEKYSKQVVTIDEVKGSIYYIKEDNNQWNWTEEMFSRKAKKRQEETLQEVLQEAIENLTDQLGSIMRESYTILDDTFESGMNKISEQINKRTMYDETLQSEMINKAKAISVDELKEELHNEVKEYIKSNFGIIPKKIQINKGKSIKKIDGIFHKKFEEILQIVNKNVPLMLTGPAGAGKNYTLEQVAEALDLEFYFTNAITQEYKLTGFIDANGVYQETQFYKAFKDGGLFFLDEVDASVPEALIILNSAIANGYFDFPNGRVNAHENFRVVCAGNTYGTGADMVYVGRNALDGATLDRFVVIGFDYDEEVERQLAYDDELYNFIVDLRKVIKNNSLRYIISMRATINATKLLEIDVNKDEILKTVIIKNMQIDDLNTIKHKIDSSNTWGKELKKIIEGM